MNCRISARTAVTAWIVAVMIDYTAYLVNSSFFRQLFSKMSALLRQVP